jgi:molybdopterin molybdotransferase
MIPISKAINIIKRETKSIDSEVVRISACVGRILAENIVADTDMPPFDRSQMDGFAVKAKDTANAPVRLKIAGESAAGKGWHNKLRAGEAVRIMTGASVPLGADSIQKVELTNESNGTVTINEPTDVTKYIVKKGAEIKKGERLFRTGERINEKMIASLAAFGYSSVKVYEKPSVSILGTGSEIVPIDKQPGQDQIRNSNSVMLKVLCEQAGARASVVPLTGDDLEKLKSTISRAVGLDRRKSKIQNPNSKFLVITGGVSVGKYDLTKAALRDLGAEIFFEKVRLRPGKPAVFAKLNGTLIFALPGNPVSAAVTFYLFVRPAIQKMQNASNTDLHQGVAVLTSTAKAAKERDTYLPATLETDKNGRLLVTPLRWHGSSDFVGFAKADALIFIARGEIIESENVCQIVYL